MDLRQQLNSIGIAVELEEPDLSELDVKATDRGRKLARRALAAAGFSGQAELERGVGRAPRWPSGYVGSISHCDSLVGAIATSSANARSIGLDIERSDRPTRLGLKERISAAEEDSAGITPLQLFSVKEACFKALRPLTLETFAFQKIKLQFLDLNRFEFSLATEDKLLRGSGIIAEVGAHCVVVASLASERSDV